MQGLIALCKIGDYEAVKKLLALEKESVDVRDTYHKVWSIIKGSLHCHH